MAKIHLIAAALWLVPLSARAGPIRTPARAAKPWLNPPTRFLPRPPRGLNLPRLAAPLVPQFLPAPAKPQTPAAAPRHPAWDDAQAVARRLGMSRGIGLEGHGILLENLARYLYNAYPDETLAALARGQDGLSTQALPAAPRWMDKILRDLEQPYTDDEVSAHLNILQAELVEAVRVLREWSPSGGFTLTLMGGIVRGRLSARSDLDVILRTDDEALFEKAMSHPFGYLVKARFVILSPAAINKRVGRALGPKFDIGDGSAALENPNFLREFYQERRRELVLESLDRELPPEKLEIFLELKKLSKKRLRYPPGDQRRLDIDERMRRLSKQLWPD